MTVSSISPVAEQRSPSVPRRDGPETRERSRELMDRLVDATPSDRRAIRDEVVTLHLWLAASVARRYGPHGELDDLVQVARIGLVEAFDRFEPGRTSYSTFAWVTATGLLRRHLRDLGWSVRPPRALQESANKLRRVIPELTQDLGRSPSTTDAAEHLGWTPGAVREARVAGQGLRATSLEALVGDGWVPEQPSDWEAVETRVLLGQALRTLSDEERDLLRLRFLDELSQAQIAAVLGINQMAVSRRLARLLTKLRDEIGDLDDAEAGRQAQPA
jgi:RNA polymerase sigma-B factor